MDIITGVRLTHLIAHGVIAHGIIGMATEVVTVLVGIMVTVDSVVIMVTADLEQVTMVDIMAAIMAAIMAMTITGAIITGVDKVTQHGIQTTMKPIDVVQTQTQQVV